MGFVSWVLVVNWGRRGCMNIFRCILLMLFFLNVDFCLGGWE